MLEYAVVRSRLRRKTLSLTVDDGGGVRVSVPVRTARRTIQQFVARHAEWIRRCQAARAAAPPPVPLVSGAVVPYLGRGLSLAVHETARARATVDLDGDALHIGIPARLDADGRQAATRQALLAWYRAEANEQLTSTTARWSKLTGLQPTAVLIRDQRRRWGSCSRDGTLRFNWRLVLVDPPLTDYVVVHELAHLRVANHSATFWAEVAAIMPDYAARRTALNRIHIQDGSWA